MKRILLTMAILVLAAELHARVGGGSSYSGGGSSSSSSSGSSSSYSGRSGSSGGGGGSTGGGFEVVFTFAIMLLLFVGTIGQAINNRGNAGTTTRIEADVRRPASRSIDALRRFDPNFSRVVFEDFCYSLYGRVYNALGSGNLDRYAPYVHEVVRRGMALHAPRNLREIRGIIVGSIEIGGLGLTPNEPVATVDVTYQSNMTTVVEDRLGRRETSWYVRERWTFERRRDILSPPPAQAQADHCPRCGGALSTRTDGVCDYCGVKIESGDFHWFVRNVAVEEKESRGPLLTSSVEEQGTELSTRLQLDLAVRKKEFEAANAEFRWEAFIERVRLIAVEVQAAWSSRDWERARTLETEPLFQMHRYWIDAYLRQGLRNVVEGFRITKILPVKIDRDAFYDAITVRIWAYGRDMTLDGNDQLVAGSGDIRYWTEYWTLVRARGAAEGRTLSCPNCGAAVAMGSTGTCTHCTGKLTAGTFDWILSRIEQDESYVG